jgi:hypothetical protein
LDTTWSFMWWRGSPGGHRQPEISNGIAVIFAYLYISLYFSYPSCCVKISATFALQLSYNWERAFVSHLPTEEATQTKISTVFLGILEFIGIYTNMLIIIPMNFYLEIARNHMLW